METLNEQDLDNLTKMQQRLMRMRKREAANTNRLCPDFTEAIQKIHWMRQMLQARMSLPVDESIKT